MYKNVLIPVDVAMMDEAKMLLQTAKEMTAPWDATCHVVSVMPTVGMAIVGSYMDAGFEDRGRAELAEQLSMAVAASGLTAQEHVLAGTVYDQVIALAERLGCDLIIIGAHQPDLRDYLLGSNAARVVRHSKQSVLVVRSG